MGQLFDDLMEDLDNEEAYMKGDQTGMKVHVPAEIDVAKIRKGLKMTQVKFCRKFGFSLDTVKHWEGGTADAGVGGAGVFDGHCEESRGR